MVEKKVKFAIVLCGGESVRFGRDKMSARLLTGSVSRTVVEKFCDFTFTCVVLPLDKLMVWRDIRHYMEQMAHEKTVRTLANQLRDDLDSGIMRMRKPEIYDFFYECYQFPEAEYLDYCKTRKRKKRVMPWDDQTARLIFWEMWELAWLSMRNRGLVFVPAGSDRGESVRNGLIKIMDITDGRTLNTVVSIHDGARPFVTKQQIEKTVTSAFKFGSGVLAVPNRDTLRKFDKKRLLENVDREVMQIQTPQVFNLEKILKAYGVSSYTMTDDSQVYSALYEDCRYVLGSHGNFKITYPEDIEGMSYSCGYGYDVHQLGEGKKFVLGGIEIPHTKGMVAHSDGDALIHALCDALLASIGKKDIGHQFPDTDDAFKGIDSKNLLKICVDMLKEEGRKIVNVSCMIMVEKPKIAPHIDNMRAVLADVLEISKSQVAIAATTTERLGIIGDERGIACCAFVLVN